MIDLSEVQSLVLRPHASPRVDLAFLHLANAADLRALLDDAASAVTFSGPRDPSRTAINIGLSGDALRLLDLGERAFSALPAAFVRGMAASATRLGDVEESGPEFWTEPFQLGATTVHAVVIALAPGPASGVAIPAVPDWGGLSDHVGRHLAPGGHWKGTGLLGGSEPFGFVDGISNPVIEGAGRPVTPGNGVWDAGLGRWRPVKAGEAVLGHRDEAGVVTGHPDAAQIERDGSYLVIRKLEQDVDGFWTSCGAWADRLNAAGGAGSVPWTADEVATQMVGRHPDGRLVSQAEGEEPSNDVLYRAGVRRAAGVAPSSHIRRANPRDDMENADQLAKRHLLFRRGIPYVEPVSDAPEDDDAPSIEKQGLIFMAACADIRRQFEFVNSHWLKGGNRFGFGPEPDPLTGSRIGPLGPPDPETGQRPGPLGGAIIADVPEDADADPRTFDTSIAGRDGERIRCRGLASFVHTRGGAYVLLPSRSALHRLADWRTPP